MVGFLLNFAVVLFVVWEVSHFCFFLGNPLAAMEVSEGTLLSGGNCLLAMLALTLESGLSIGFILN